MWLLCRCSSALAGVAGSAFGERSAACRAEVLLTAFEKPKGRRCGAAAGPASTRRCLSALTAASALRRSYCGRKYALWATACVSKLMIHPLRKHRRSVHLQSNHEAQHCCRAEAIWDVYIPSRLHTWSAAARSVLMPATPLSSPVPPLLHACMLFISWLGHDSSGKPL